MNALDAGTFCIDKMHATMYGPGVVMTTASYLD